jgi:hypothetical protein
MPQPEQLEGLTWNSFVYQPTHPVDGFTGPDRETRCEAPRHRIGDRRPPAAWLELLWYPERLTVARSWKTCDDCHVGMAASAERARN